MFVVVLVSRLIRCLGLTSAAQWESNWLWKRYPDQPVLSGNKAFIGHFYKSGVQQQRNMGTLGPPDDQGWKLLAEFIFAF